MNHEAMDHTDERQQTNTVPLSRRKFLLAGGATVFAAGAGVSALVGKLMREDPQQTVRDRLRQTYLQTHCIEYSDDMADLYVAYEWEEMQKKGAVKPGSREHYCEATRDFLDKVQHGFIGKALADEHAPDDAGQPQHMLAILKNAMEETYPQGVQYNKDANSILHVPGGLLQCRSATRMFVLAAKKTFGTFPGKAELVEVHTEGHVRPGCVLNDGRIFALEMTIIGSSPHCLGSMAASPADVQIVRIDDVLAAAMLKLSSSDCQPPLLDTAQKKSIDRTKKEVPILSERYGFGEVKIPSGNRPLPRKSADEVHEERREAQQIADLYRMLPAEHHQALQEYLSHLEHLKKIAREMRDIIGDPAALLGMSDAQLERMYARIAPLHEKRSQYEEQYSIEEMGLRILAQAGLEHSKHAWKKTQQQKADAAHGPERMTLTFIQPGQRHDEEKKLRAEHAQYDPMTPVSQNADYAQSELWEYIRDQRPALHKKITSQWHQEE